MVVRKDRYLVEDQEKVRFLVQYISVFSPCSYRQHLANSLDTENIPGADLLEGLALLILKTNWASALYILQCFGWFSTLKKIPHTGDQASLDQCG